jgi:hypothetical protein
MRRLARYLLIIFAFAMGGHLAAGELPTEDRLKAGFVGNFIQFTRWPGKPDSIVVCGFDARPDDDPLAQLNGAEHHRSMLTVRRVKSVAEVRGCQAFFLDSANAARLPDLLAVAAGQALLIITEFEGGAPLGAALSLVATGGGRLGFDVNLTAARAVGLDFNARLLQLARRVY